VLHLKKIVAKMKHRLMEATPKAQLRSNTMILYIDINSFHVPSPLIMLIESETGIISKKA
jgi:hypothetical protein